MKKNKNSTLRTKKIDGAWVVRQSELKIEISNIGKTMAFVYYAGSAQYATWNTLLDSDDESAMKILIIALGCTANLYFSVDVLTAWIDINKKHLDSVDLKEISEEDDQKIIEELKNIEKDGKDTLAKNN